MTTESLLAYPPPKITSNQPYTHALLTGTARTGLILFKKLAPTTFAENRMNKSLRKLAKMTQTLQILFSGVSLSKQT